MMSLPLSDVGPALALSRAPAERAPGGSHGDRVDGERSAAWLTAMSLRQQIAATAASIAETEEWVADTLDRLARVRPHDAERLRARAMQARLFAARERAQAAIYRSRWDLVLA